MRAVEKYIKNNWESVIRTNTEDSGTLIGLPFPYTVPCSEGKFQELYYWDTYFTNVGLILSDRVELAKNNIDNMLFLAEKFGFMPNGNRYYYQYRSQPPFLSQMVREVYKQITDKDWLSKAYPILCKEYDFWQHERMTSTELNRYYGQKKSYLSEADNWCRRIKVPLPESEAEQERYGESAYSMCESGWDCSSRFGYYAQDIVPVDLNALLYGIEDNMAFFSNELSLNKADLWNERKEKRLKLMNKIMWDEKIGAFCDYDFRLKQKSTLCSTAMFYPLACRLTTDEQARKTVAVLSKLEQPYGVAGCENREDIMQLQWDYPHGWACQQFMVIKGLSNYGYHEDAVRIAKKYIGVVERNFESSGNLWEKYNVVDGTVSVTKEYETPTMMGWSAGVYLYCADCIRKAEEK